MSRQLPDIPAGTASLSFLSDWSRHQCDGREIRNNDGSLRSRMRTLFIQMVAGLYDSCTRVCLRAGLAESDLLSRVPSQGLPGTLGPSAVHAGDDAPPSVGTPSGQVSPPGPGEV